jgi:subtilisin-like proprotein convertase family protein
MRKHILSTRIVLVALTALLALPNVQISEPVEAKRRGRTVTRTFSNPAPIPLPITESNPAAADLYPSAITVGGLKGKVRDVDLVLNGLSHAATDQVQVLLVGPRGQTAIVMASTGSTEAVNGVTLRLDDEATTPLPSDGDTGLRSGTFRPANAAGGAIPFLAPAPSVKSANAALAVFDGSDPRGGWRLFVQDHAGLAAAGSVSGGWELEITTKAKAKKRR